MAIVVKVNAVDVTEKWQRGQETAWEDPLNGRGTGRITFADVPGGFKPSDGQTIEIIDGATTAFAGVLMEPQLSEPDAAGVIFYSCQMADYNILADRRNVSDNYEDLALELIVSGIVTDHMDGEGISLAGVEAGPALTSLNPNIKATESFNAISDATGRAWFIDVDKTMNFRQRTSISAPADLDGDTLLIGTPQVREDRQKYRNEQIIKAGTEEFPIFVLSGRLAEINARAAIEGTSGIYSDVQEFPEILNQDVALEKAGDLLDRFARITKVVTGTTRTAGFRAGQSANVDLPDFDINNEVMLIENVQARVVTEGNEQVLWYSVKAITGDPFGGWMEHFRKAPPVKGPLRFQNDPGLFRVDPKRGVVVHDPPPGFDEWFQAAASGTLTSTPSAFAIAPDGTEVVGLRRGGVAGSGGCPGGQFPGCTGSCFANRQSVLERFQINENNVIPTTPTGCVSWDELKASANFKSLLGIRPQGDRICFVQGGGLPVKFGVASLTAGLLGSVDTTITDSATPGEVVWTTDDYVYYADEGSAGLVFIYDVRDPANPIEVGSFSTGMANIAGLRLDSTESYLFATSPTGNDIVSIDITSRESLSVVTTLAPTRNFVSLGYDAEEDRLLGMVRAAASTLGFIVIDINPSTGALTIRTEGTVPYSSTVFDGYGAIARNDRVIAWSERNVSGVNTLEANVLDYSDPDAPVLFETLQYNHGLSGNIGPTSQSEAVKSFYLFNFGGSTQITFAEEQIEEPAPLSIDCPLRVGFGGTGISSYLAGDIVYADRKLPDDERGNGELERLAIGNLGDVLTVSGFNGGSTLLPAWLPAAGGGGGADAGDLLFTSSDVFVSSGALQDLDDLEALISSGVTYYFRAELFYDAAATLGHRYAIGGSATGNVIYQIRSLDDSTGEYSIIESGGRQTELGGSAGVAPLASGTQSGYTEISGTIECTGDGTIVPQFGVF